MARATPLLQACERLEAVCRGDVAASERPAAIEEVREALDDLAEELSIQLA